MIDVYDSASSYNSLEEYEKACQISKDAQLTSITAEHEPNHPFFSPEEALYQFEAKEQDDNDSDIDLDGSMYQYTGEYDVNSPLNQKHRYLFAKPSKMTLPHNTESDDDDDFHQEPRSCDVILSCIDTIATYIPPPIKEWFNSYHWSEIFGPQGGINLIIQGVAPIIGIIGAAELTDLQHYIPPTTEVLRAIPPHIQEILYNASGLLGASAMASLLGNLLYNLQPECTNADCHCINPHLKNICKKDTHHLCCGYEPDNSCVSECGHGLNLLAMLIFSIPTCCYGLPCKLTCDIDISSCQSSFPNRNCEPCAEICLGQVPLPNCINLSTISQTLSVTLSAGTAISCYNAYNHLSPENFSNWAPYFNMLNTEYARLPLPGWLIAIYILVLLISIFYQPYPEIPSSSHGEPPYENI